MTNEELRKALEDGITNGRQKAARITGAHIVLAIEALGLRIVPVELIEPIQKVLEAPVPTANGKQRRG